MRAGAEAPHSRALDPALKVREGFLKEVTSELKPEGPMCAGQTVHAGWQGGAMGVGDDPQGEGTTRGQCGQHRHWEGRRQGWRSRIGQIRQIRAQWKGSASVKQEREMVRLCAKNHSCNFKIGDGEGTERIRRSLQQTLPLSLDSAQQKKAPGKL